MKAYYSDTFVLPLPPDHRFPMAKYSELRRRVIAEGVLDENQLHESPRATRQELLRVHSADYVRRVTEGDLTDKEIRRIGFPWSPGMVERSHRSVGGTLAAMRSAPVDGVGLNLAGGTHHARADCGAGFCVFNDVAVAARTAQAEDLAKRVLLLDCDVHQGDGSATIFADDSSVFTFSIHGAKNYPFNKIPGDMDIALPDGAGDEEYLDVLKEGVWRALAQANPDLIMYISGADPYSGDSFGRLGLSKEGLRIRDQWILFTLAEHNIPTTVVMGGGYARDINDIVDIHLGTIEAALESHHLRHNTNLPRPG